MDDEPAHILEVDAVLHDKVEDDEVVFLEDEVVLHHMVQAVVGKAPT